MGSLGQNPFLLDILELKCRPLGHVDRRSDEEIMEVITHPPPVSSEKNVWAFWDSGFTNMRTWCQRNVIGWVRLLGPEWTVRVLDLVDGSASNVLKWVDASNLPAHLSNQTKTGGRFAGSNISDTIRLPAVYQHGGVWMDAGIMLFAHLDDVCWKSIMSPSSRFEVAVASGDASLMSGLAENFFVASRKGNSFVRRWMSILLEAWRGKTSNKGLHAHPLFRHLIEGGNITRVFNGASGDKLDYFQAYLAWERLRLLEDPNDGFSGPSYCKNRVLLLEYREFASAAMLTNNSGQKQLDLLRTSYKENKTSQDYLEAKQFCEHMLSQTAMMKLYHWKDDDVATLADLWDRPENLDADCRPGTFAECLRFVSTHYNQARKITSVRFPEITENILVAGVLEF